MSRCSLCPGTHRQVFPIGPKTARIFLIGEGPGKNEDKDGIPFVGVSGREQDHTYFGLAGLDRRDIFISNCVQCRCERGGADVRPGAALLSACAANHLREEILTVQPQIIILAGATACSLVGVNLEYDHGFPFYYTGSGLWGWQGWIVPMYHPAAGIRETRYMIPLLEDWRRFGQWLRGEWEPPRVEEYRTDYRLIEDPNELGKFLANDKAVAIDTESDDGQPYSIQCSTSPGRAFMVLASNKKATEGLRSYLRGRHAIMHNSLYDLEELERLRIQIGSWDDTMQQIYHLGGILPQGLKPAVYRVFGFRMTSYDDVVTPASLAKLDDWLAEALAFSSQSMRYSTHHTKGKGCPACGKNHRADKTEYKAHESEAVIRRVMKHVAEGENYDPWKPPSYAKGELKLRLIGRDWMEPIEREIGRMPRPSIIHAPLARQIQYACGDADWTGQLAQWLVGERERIVQQEWRVT